MTSDSEQPHRDPGFGDHCSLGRRPAPGNQGTASDWRITVFGYLALLCAEARKAGLPPDKVYTHQGGTYIPWEKSLPWWPAFNADATPGWSFYFTDPADATGLGDTLDRRGAGRWAAVEWWWQGDDEAGWRKHFERTLAFRDCRFLVIYNWNCGGLSFSQHPEGLRALRAVIRDWKERPCQ